MDKQIAGISCPFSSERKLSGVHRAIEETVKRTGWQTSFLFSDMKNYGEGKDRILVFDRLISALRSVDCLIADISDEYTGTGMALAAASYLRKPLILSGSQETDLFDLTLNLNGFYKAIRYSSAVDLKERLINVLNDLSQEIIRSRPKGKLFVFEGLDGSGKSTVVNIVASELLRQGKGVTKISDPPDIEPWSTFKEYFERGERINKIAEAFLLVASRIDITLRAIEQALLRGDIVLADRYYPSWLAYQEVRLSKLLTGRTHLFLNQLQCFLEANGLVQRPDAIIFLWGDPAVFAERLGQGDRKGASKYDNLDFQQEVNRVYGEILAGEHSQVFFVETDTLSLEDVVAKVMSFIG